MHTAVRKLPKSQAELTITITPSDYDPYLLQAAEELSREKAIAGFRPGKAPLEVVKQHAGEGALLQKAVEIMLPHTLASAVTEHALQTVGQPGISIEKMAPGSDVALKAILSLLPEMKLAHWKKITVAKKPIDIAEAQIDAVLEELRTHQAKEILVARRSAKPDKVTIDMDILLDKAPVEGGQAKNHQVYLDESHYIPGFPEELIGLSENESKEFTLPFPKDHFQKHLAGKQAQFKVQVKGVYERQLPPLDDALAATVGQKTLADLRALIRQNLTLEAEQKESQRLEIELLEKILARSAFGELPEILIASEKQKMFAELQNQIEQMGTTLEEYLKNINKTAEEIAQGFSEPAEKRARIALIMRAIALEEHIAADPKELADELASIKKQFADSPNIDERLASPDIRDYVASTLVNRKALALLKKQCI